MDREEIPDEWTGRQVIVRLTSSEARGVEIIATLHERADAGITLSEIGELGPGPTIFCPWNSIQDIHPQSPEGSAFYESEEVGTLPYEETEEILRRFRPTSARNLERVVPVAQKLTVGEITVAIASLELYGEGLGVLRWQISLEGSLLRNRVDFDPSEAWFEIRDGEGRDLPCSLHRAGGSSGEANGDVRVEELPDSGDLEVEVTRLVTDAYADEEYAGSGPPYEGPWTFRFSL